ncbi:MAG: phasin family protein, partial [Betaproteobacteria bacterium]|nr:phasin family protein [Betaproteobacteria bacterium]
VPGLVALQQSLAKPAVEKALAYSRAVYDAVSQQANALAQLFEGHASEMNKNVSSAIDKALKNAPAGSEVAVSAANTAFDQMNKAARQVTEFAEANVAAANAATVKLVNKAA